MSNAAGGGSNCRSSAVVGVCVSAAQSLVSAAVGRIWATLARADHRGARHGLILLIPRPSFTS